MNNTNEEYMQFSALLLYYLFLSQDTNTEKVGKSKQGLTITVIPLKIPMKFFVDFLSKKKAPN
jgi:hypothetical protein